MKKLLCSFASLFLLFTAINANESFISFNAGLSSGIPFYGENSIPENSQKITTDYRVIVGTFANININVIKQVSFFGGTDILSDFNWRDTAYNNHLHVTFPLGFKIYPDLKGFNFGLAYTLGFRSDFYKSSLSSNSYNVASWGNGFKLFLEYDFAHDGKSKYLPLIGCSWNLMPRGNYSYDNIITFYLGENF